MCLNIMILRNFLKIHLFGKILTHGSVGDCFSFSSVPPIAPPQKKTECHLTRRYIVFIYNLYDVSGIVGGGGKALIFTIILI